MTRFAAALLAIACGTASAQDAPGSPERPIIAALVAEPERYLGRRVEVYGVVVQSATPGPQFRLQDASQRPLLVVAPRGESAKVHEQFIVIGVVERFDGELGLRAERLTPARVTAGGGCC